MKAFRSVKLKVLLAVTLVAGVALAVILASAYTQMKRAVTDGEMKHYETLYTTVTNDIEAVSQTSEMGILTVVNNPEIQQAFAARDRERLAALTVPLFAAVKDKGVEQFQFHLAPATSFLRAHSPGKFGDDLSSFRATVVECNRSKAVVKGLEEGRADIGFRVVAPVFCSGRHIGSAEYGLGFQDDMLARWKDQMGGEFFIYRGNTGGVTWDEDVKPLIIGSTENDGYTVPQETIDDALSTGEMRVANIDQDRQAALIIPLKDYTGKPVAYVKAVQDRSDVLAGLQDALRSTLMLLILSLGAMAVLLYFVLSSILRPVGELREAAETVASGDLTAEVRVRADDEIGALAASFRTMAHQLRGVVQQVIGKAGAISEYTQTLSATSQQTAASANETAATVNEIATSVDRVASNVEQISAASQRASTKADEGRKSIVKVNGQMKQIAESTRGISQVIDGLSRKSGEIDQIVTLIANIADQTNLLALNAAIEAARAGEHGRGFAVVAEEVRKLAEQSASAAKEINALITAIQDESAKAVNSVIEGGKQVEVGTGVVQEVGGFFNEIADAVNGLTVQIQEAVAATGQMSAGVKNVASFTEEQTAALQEVSASIESLTGLCEEMGALVKKFKV